MSKHTPGPWTIERVRYQWKIVGPYSLNKNGQLRRIASLGSPHGYNPDSSQVGIENAANARLIAAAPELLAALENLCDCMDEVLPYLPRPNAAADHAWNRTVQARAAIAKAESDLNNSEVDWRGPEFEIEVSE